MPDVRLSQRNIYCSSLLNTVELDSILRSNIHVDLRSRPLDGRNYGIGWSSCLEVCGFCPRNARLHCWVPAGVQSDGHSQTVPLAAFRVSGVVSVGVRAYSGGWYVLCRSTLASFVSSLIFGFSWEYYLYLLLNNSISIFLHIASRKCSFYLNSSGLRNSSRKFHPVGNHGISGSVRHIRDVYCLDFLVLVEAHNLAPD